MNTPALGKRSQKQRNDGERQSSNGMVTQEMIPLSYALKALLGEGVVSE